MDITGFLADEKLRYVWNINTKQGPEKGGFYISNPNFMRCDI